MNGMYTTITISNIIKDKTVPQSLKKTVSSFVLYLCKKFQDIKDPIKKTEFLHKQAQEAYEEDLKFPDIIGNNCSKGCNACCHMYVDLHQCEVSYFQKIFDNFSYEKKKNLRVRLNKQAKFTHADWFKAKRRVSACVFLENGLCGIYDKRPLMCRKYFVRNDPKECWRDGDALIVGHTNMEMVSTAIATHEKGEFISMSKALLEKRKNLK